jgi:long-chain acyl-CoA synthetase
VALLTLARANRKKDMIISGGFNVYPSHLEAVLLRHESVFEAAVVGVPPEQWGETPVAFVALKRSRPETAAQSLKWANSQLGKCSGLRALKVVPELPRNALGKVLKREPRDRYEKACQALM